jgi:uncharacterized protein YqgV (UPF0045/DUF77 family)
MARISAQVSVYPLRQASLSPAIEAALTVFRSHKLEVQPGVMSTMISGDDDEVFASLKETFQQAARFGDVVMNVTLSNACPVKKTQCR